MDDREPETLRERIVKLLGRSDLTQSDFSCACGFARAYLGLIVKGRRRDLGVEKLAALALTTGASLDYLVLGRGNAPTEDTLREAVARAQRDPERHRRAIAAVLGIPHRAPSTLRRRPHAPSPRPRAKALPRHEARS